MGSCVDVAVAGAAFQFDKLYSYTVPPALEDFAKVGARVLVPFGRAKPRMGVILSLSESEEENLREIIDIERDEPLLGDELVKLVFLLKQQTLCSYYDAVKAVLPKNSRLVADFGESVAKIAKASRAHKETAYRKAALPVSPHLTARQKEVLDAIGGETLSYAEIEEKTGVSRDVIKRLINNGILEIVERDKTIEIYRDYEQYEDYSLTTAQDAAYREIKEYMRDDGRPDATLLYGITSSGKTLIYNRLIEDAVSAGRQALLLVPEIALATQMIYRFKELFGERVGIIHSSLSDTERQLQWQRIRDGGCDLVVGTRSAVFAPLESIGIIIVDEEQEQTYLSEQNPRYHALSVAKFRAKYHGAHLLLSSATPSIESYHAAVEGKTNLVTLNERYRDMPLPEVKVVDMRSELLAGNGLCISEHLKEEIGGRLVRKEQCILLLNRRGYRTVSICSSCKTIIKCKSCDTALVFHKNIGRYVCHYCGHNEPYREICGECGGNIRHTGIGTQKIEEELALLFPDVKVLRLDLDTVGRKHSLEEKITAFARGDYDIIIGTQMIAKGLDFKNVTLVGVLSIDQLLLMPSFRASERTFSMLTQVVGRSGRGNKTGEAVIQTIDPENPIIRMAAKQDYPTFYESEIVSRKLHLYPPFCAVSSAGFIGPKEKESEEAASAFAEIVERKVKAAKGKIPIRLLGPSPMRVSYVNDLFRFKLTMKSRGDRLFREMVTETLEEYYTLKLSRDVKAYVNFYDDSDI